MNRVRYLILLVGYLHIIHAGKGCVSNSFHLHKAHDPKTHHYVECNCPCNRYPMYGNGTCSKCLHRQDTRLTRLPLTITNTTTGHQKKSINSGCLQRNQQAT